MEIRGVGGGGSYSLGKIGGAPTSMSWLGVDGLSDVGSKRSAEGERVYFLFIRRDLLFDFI